jgi:RES domain-containing protein
MEVFRISTDIYSSALTASGAANRWNFANEFVLYTGASRSLSTLELVVHRNTIKPAGVYKVMVISIADEDELITQFLIKDLPSNWRTPLAYPQLNAMGSAWYSLQQSLILKIPSAIIINEYNYIINTKHPDFITKVNLVRTEDYFWDSRLT